MAYRIHVTAIRNSAVELVRKTYLEILGDCFGDVKLIEHAGWISFRTSVWQVSSRDLIEGLQQLNQPGLRFTTEDGSRWYVTMCSPGNEPETMIHEFGNHDEMDLDELDYADEEEDDYVDPELAFLEEEPQSPPHRKTPFHRFADQYAELGAALPQSLIDEVGTLSLPAAINRFRTWHQDRFVEFLTSAGVQFNADAVRGTLSWQGLTEVERDSDLGNLPRLLSQIGLGREWDNYISEAENPPAESEDEYNDDEDFVPSNPKRFIEEAERIIGTLDATPVENGPVKLALDKISYVTLFPEACQVENEIKALLIVQLPEAFEPSQFNQLTSGSRMNQAGCEWIPGGFKIGFENQLLVNWPHFRKQLGLEFSQFIERLPNGSEFALAFGAEREPATRQIYCGEVIDRVWQITATHPPVPAVVLSDALSVAADAPKNSHTLRDAPEADAVMEAVKKDSFLHGMDVKRADNSISCEYDVEFLAKIILRLRFREYWDVGPHEKHADKEYRQRIKLEWEFRRKAAKQARIQSAPRIGDPIYRGTSSVYWNSDLGHFKDLDPEIGEKFQRGMKSLHFNLLGDLTPKRFRGFVLRCYVSPDGFSYANLTASIYGYLCWEFISDFSDGSRLTTTTQGMAFSRPAAKLYFKDFPGLGVEELYEKHLHLFERFQEGKKASPIPLEPTLVGLAKLFDDSIARTDADEANREDEDEDEFGDEEFDGDDT